MRRAQVYLDESLWKALRKRARREETSISELLRRAASERYFEPPEERRVAMQAIVGIWKDRKDIPDTEKYLRDLRKGDRMERLHRKR